MIEHAHKRKLKKVSKSDKRRAAGIREEIEWLERESTKQVWPFSIPEKGEARRVTALIVLKLELQEIYGEDNRQR